MLWNRFIYSRLGVHFRSSNKVYRAKERVSISDSSHLWRLFALYQITSVNQMKQIIKKSSHTLSFHSRQELQGISIKIQDTWYTGHKKTRNIKTWVQLIWSFQIHLEILKVFTTRCIFRIDVEPSQGCSNGLVIQLITGDCRALTYVFENNCLFLEGV